jgi:ADP-ribose pyrophosphatase YjhB (NUDIX family)
MRVFRRLPRRLRRLIIHAVTPSYSVGAVIALVRADRTLLLVEQRHSPGWALPGGLLHRGESAAAGVVREVAEEVGLELDPDRLPVPYAVVAPNAKRVDIVYVTHLDDGATAAAGAGDDVRIADRLEVTGVGWFDLDRLPDISEPTMDILRGVRLL